MGLQEDSGGFLNPPLRAEIGTRQRNVRQEITTDLGSATTRLRQRRVDRTLRAVQLVQDGATMPHEMDLGHVAIVWHVWHVFGDEAAAPIGPRTQGGSHPPTGDADPAIGSRRLGITTGGASAHLC